MSSEDTQGEGVEEASTPTYHYCSLERRRKLVESARAKAEQYIDRAAGGPSQQEFHLRPDAGSRVVAAHKAIRALAESGTLEPEVVTTLESGLSMLVDQLRQEAIPSQTDGPLEGELCYADLSRIRRRYIEPIAKAPPGGVRIAFSSGYKANGRRSFITAAWQYADLAGEPKRDFEVRVADRLGVSSDAIRKYLKDCPTFRRAYDCG